MKLALNIKNMSKALRPKENDVIIYEGKDWYITTKEDLLKDCTTLLNECREQLEKSKKEYKDFKSDVASQLLEMSELIKKLYSK